MQLLIDSTQETPASLRFIARTLCELADTYGPPIDLMAPSINGPSTPIVLHAHGPAAPIDPRPQAPLDPAVVFGVPAGTINPTPAAAATFVPGVSTGVGVAIPLAPPAPAAPNATQHAPVTSFVDFAASAPPAPTMTPTNALLATITTETIVPLAPSPPLAAVAPSAVASAVGNATQTVPTPSTGAAITAGAAERDKDGLPWDARVHSETRKMNADGTWRNRRNLDANVKATVMAELRALFQNVPPASPQLPLAPPAPVPQAPPAPTAPVAPQPPTAPLSVPVGVPLGLPNTGQPAVLPALGFRDFMSAVNKATAAGTLTTAQLDQACKAVNLDGISALASEPGKISLVHAQVAHLLGAATA